MIKFEELSQKEKEAIRNEWCEYICSTSITDEEIYEIVKYCEGTQALLIRMRAAAFKEEIIKAMRLRVMVEWLAKTFNKFKERYGW